MGACQIATQACHFCPEGTHRHGQRRLTTALGQHGQHQRLNHLVSRTLWCFTSAGTNLQQAHGKRRQQTRASASGPQRFAIAVLLCDTRF